MLLTTLIQPAFAERVVNDGFFCISKSYMNEMIRACTKGDANTAHSLVNNGFCYMIDAGTSASVIERGFLLTKVRVYLGKNKNMVLWADSEYIRP